MDFSIQELISGIENINVEILTRKLEELLQDNLLEGFWEEQIKADDDSERYIPNHVTPYCDFAEIEKEHKILEYDIGSSPKYDYENTPMAEYVREQMEDNEEMSIKLGEK